MESEGIREYLIIIGLSQEIEMEVLRLKQEFLRKFGSSKYIHSKAHISLSHFLIESTPEISIVNELRQYLKKWKSFEVSISGFEKFQDTRTIFLNISTEEIKKLQGYLNTVLRQRVKIAKKFTKSGDRPHITIASTIPHSYFDDSWDYFKNRTYSKKCKIDTIRVLRKNHSMRDKYYKVASEIELAT